MWLFYIDYSAFVESTESARHRVFGGWCKQHTEGALRITFTGMRPTWGLTHTLFLVFTRFPRMHRTLVAGTSQMFEKRPIAPVAMASGKRSIARVCRLPSLAFGQRYGARHQVHWGCAFMNGRSGPDHSGRVLLVK